MLIGALLYIGDISAGTQTRSYQFISVYNLFLYCGTDQRQPYN